MADPRQFSITPMSEACCRSYVANYRTWIVWLMLAHQQDPLRVAPR
jgi:hypothetical protein